MPFEQDCLAQHGEHLLSSGQFSDFVVECGGHEFHVHKAIISASKFFEALCKGGFMESVGSRVSLKEEDPTIVARILLFMYTDEYIVSGITRGEPGRDQFVSLDDVLGKAATTSSENLARAKLHVLIYAAADKYCITHLIFQASVRLAMELVRLDMLGPEPPTASVAITELENRSSSYLALRSFMHGEFSDDDHCVSCMLDAVDKYCLGWMRSDQRPNERDWGYAASKHFRKSWYSIRKSCYECCSKCKEYDILSFCDKITIAEGNDQTQDPATPLRRSQGTVTVFCFKCGKFCKPTTKK